MVNIQQYLVDALPMRMLVREGEDRQGRCEDTEGDDGDFDTAVEGPEKGSKQKSKEPRKTRKEKTVTGGMIRFEAPAALTAERISRTMSKQNESAALGPIRTLPSSNLLSVSTRDGKQVLQTVRTCSDGAVVLKSLSSTIDTEECLLYLPNGTHKSVSATVLNNDEESNQVRIVLTPNFQDTYQWNDPLIRQSAIVISRPMESIQKYNAPRNAYSIVSLKSSGWIYFC